MSNKGSVNFLFSSRNIHIRPYYGSRYILYRESSERIHQYPNRKEALKKAHKIAKAEGIAIIEHRYDGIVIDRIEYQ